MTELKRPRARAGNVGPDEMVDRIVRSADEIKVGRVGHWVTGDRQCWLALITRVDDAGVDLAVKGPSFPWQDQFNVELVMAGELAGTPGTFHLNRACPWSR